MPETPTPTTEKPIELTLGDGSIVKGANLDEAFKNLAAMKEAASAEVRRQREQAETYRQQYEAVNAEVQQLKAPRPKEGEFDSKRYYDLLNTNPVAANDYYFEYRFGQKPEEFNAGYQQVAGRVSDLHQQAVTAQFLSRHGDFPQQDEAAAKALTGRVSQLMAGGLPFSLDIAELAYSQLVSEERIKPVKAADDDRAPAPPPALSGAGGGADASFATWENMSDKELEAALRSKGVLR